MVFATKREHRASEIKAAALPLLGTNAPTRRSVPKEVRSLPLFAQNSSNIDIWDLEDEQGNAGLAFVTGSGFGHWGIVVCPAKDGMKVARTLHGTITPWEDGVFFWIER